MTFGTLFHYSNVPLVQWFLASYLKEGLSALRFSKRIRPSWITAHRMQRKMRRGMVDWYSIYRLGGLVDMDDAFVDGRRCRAKSSRPTEGKTPILMAVDNRGSKSGFIAVEATLAIFTEHFRPFAKGYLLPWQLTCMDGLVALPVLGETQQDEGCVPPTERMNESPPQVHIAIGYFKTYLLGPFYGPIGRYLQEHLDKFVCRFDRRLWETELPLRLLNAGIDLAPARLAADNG